MRRNHTTAQTAITLIVLTMTIALTTQSQAGAIKRTPVDTRAMSPGVTLVGSHQKVVSQGYFITKDGSNLVNEYRMPDSSTLQARRILGAPGPWGTFTRISSDTFRSSAGHVYTILDQNRLQFNGGRVLYREVPVSGGRVPDNASRCIGVSGILFCFYD